MGSYNQPVTDTLPRAMSSLLAATTEDLFLHRQCGRERRVFLREHVSSGGPDAIPGFASCLSWNAVGELQNPKFNFHWDGTRMHYVLLYQGNQQVPLTIENYYDL